MSEFEDSYGVVTARFYDAGPGVSAQLGADVDFYRELASETGGPVLELGCGTGRVLLEIARDGLACTGLDASQAMLDVARSKASQPAPRWIHAAMQEFDLGGERFRLIFSAFRASKKKLVRAGHRTLSPANKKVCVRRELNPGPSLGKRRS